MDRHLVRLFSTGLLGLTGLACGATDRVELDYSLLWSGQNNRVRSGGYWFTYIDHISWMADHPSLNPGQHTAAEGASITPLTDMTTPLPLTRDPDPSSGHGETVHVSGRTPAAPDWNEVAADGKWFDTYYQQADLYPDSLTVAFPVTGVGFGFQEHNAPGFDPSQGKKHVGFAFDMKTRNQTLDVDLHLALVCSENNGNDLNDPRFEDAFAAPGCNYPRAKAPNQSLTDQALDYASGPNSYESQTCFLYQHKFITPVADNQWSTYCVLFNELTVPDWKGTNATPPDFTDESLAQCSTKLKWEMYKPGAGEPAAEFDVYLDNVRLVSREQMAELGCNAAYLPTDPNRVIGPSPATTTP